MFTISKSTRWIQPRHTINNSRKAKTEIELRFQFVLPTFSHGLRRDLQGGDVVSRVSGSLLPSSKQGLTALLQCCNVGAKPRTDATGLGWSTPCSSTKHIDAGGTKFLTNAPDCFDDLFGRGKFIGCTQKAEGACLVEGDAVWEEGKARSFLDPFSLQRSPVLLCNTRLPQCTSKLEQIFAHSRSQHNFACKASTKNFPVFLCVPKFAQKKTQCLFALQSLHKVSPSTTLRYKACTRHFPVLPRATRFCAKKFPVLNHRQSLPSRGKVPGSNCGQKQFSRFQRNGPRVGGQWIAGLICAQVVTSDLLKIAVGDTDISLDTARLQASTPLSIDPVAPEAAHTASSPPSYFK